jgi:hypothetical protein
MKKKHQNRKRRKRQASDEVKSADGQEFSPDLVEHIGQVVSMIEGRQVSEEETLAMLEKVLRQRSIAQGSKKEQIMRWLKKKFP